MNTIDTNTVKAKMAALLKISPERVTDDQALGDLVADSFALVELSVELQEEFGVRLFQRELKDVRTVGQLARLIVETKTRAAAE
ncbi:MAG TPA: acyl carrier protein [Polyangiaceae bacterium]